jgi:sugar phosphate isomerase/epimerase
MESTVKPVNQQVSLSAMWIKDRYDAIDDFFPKLKEWGFTHIEPTSSIPAQALDTIVRYSIPVSSIHSPCPYTISSNGIPAKELSLSSIQEPERKEAVHFAKKTIELASSTGAQAVVIHLGEIPLDITLQDKMYSLCEEENTNSIEYKDIKDQLITSRASEAAQYVNAAEQSLKELCAYGMQQNVLVGIETRYHFHEIPDINEMERFLQEVKENTVGYWHDTGHAEIQQKLGLTTHKEWLSRFKARLIGTHIHDVAGISDHYCPGLGTVEWDMVAGLLPKQLIKVCEVGGWNDENHMRTIIPFLAQKGILNKAGI